VEVDGWCRRVRVEYVLGILLCWVIDGWILITGDESD